MRVFVERVCVYLGNVLSIECMFSVVLGFGDIVGDKEVKSLGDGV